MGSTALGGVAEHLDDHVNDVFGIDQRVDAVGRGTDPGTDPVAIAVERQQCIRCSIRSDGQPLADFSPAPNAGPGCHTGPAFGTDEL